MTLTSRETVEQVLRAGRDQDVEAFVALFAPDGFIEWPYRPPGAPARLQGHDEIRRFQAEVATSFVRFEEYRNVRIHETTDPEVVVVEYDAEATVLRTGSRLRQSVIAVIEVEEGLIRSYRDYVNPLPVMQAQADQAADAT